MTDLALMVDSSDVVLLTGNAIPPASANPAGAAGKDSFSGLLSERLQEGQPGRLSSRPPSVDAPPQATAVVINQQDENNASVPLDGKTLPGLPAMLSTQGNWVAEWSVENFAGPALTLALTPGAPQNTLGVQIGSAAITLTALESGPMALSSVAPVLSEGVKTLAQAVGGGQFAPPVGVITSEHQPLAATSAKQFQAAVPDSDIGKGRTTSATGSVSPLLQPLSASIQRALAQAINAAGLARPTTVAGSSVALQSSAASLQANGLTMAMQQLAKGNIASVASMDSRAISQLPIQQGQGLSSAIPETSTSPVSDASGLLSSLPRLSGSSGSSLLPLLPISTPVGQSGWANEVGQRVVWLAQSELREAQLQLHPRSLGPVEVRIVFGADQQLNVSFTAINPVAREALDAALPRLREMFEQQGLTLADANISQQSFADQHKNTEEDAGDNSGHAADGGDLQADYVLAPGTVLMGNGLIDAYV